MSLVQFRPEAPSSPRAQQQVFPAPVPACSLPFIPCGFSSFGRARPCQGRGSGFDPRNPLHEKSLICLPDKLGFFRTKCSAAAEREVPFRREVHCVREVCLRHDMWNASLHFAPKAQYFTMPQGVTSLRYRRNFTDLPFRQPERLPGAFCVRS